MEVSQGAEPRASLVAAAFWKKSTRGSFQPCSPSARRDPKGTWLRPRSGAGCRSAVAGPALTPRTPLAPGHAENRRRGHVVLFAVAKPLQYPLPLRGVV